MTTTSKKIVLIGASGVGKTSLAQLLSEKLQLALIPELAREVCHQLGYQNPTEVPNQENFRASLLEQQLLKEAELESFIADRGSIDCWVMWQRWQLCSAMTYTTEAYYKTCRDNAQHYTHVIYIPPLFRAQEDAFRWTDADYIKQIDRLTRLTLYDWELLDRTYTIKSAAISERVQEVTSWLGVSNANG